MHIPTMFVGSRLTYCIVFLFTGGLEEYLFVFNLPHYNVFFVAACTYIPGIGVGE